MSSYCDAGYGRKKVYAKFSEFMDKFSLAMEDYVKTKDNNSFNDLEDIMGYVIWGMIGEAFSFKECICGIKKTVVTGYSLSLALFDPNFVDLTDKGKHSTKSSFNVWLTVSKSSILGAGLGLFAARTF